MDPTKTSDSIAEDIKLNSSDDVFKCIDELLFADLATEFAKMMESDDKEGEELRKLMSVYKL